MTIEERAKASASRAKGLFPYSILLEDIIKGLTEQDRIARQEERERCIQIAQDKMCSICRAAHNSCGYGVICTFGECDEREKLRKSMEGGEYA